MNNLNSNTFRYRYVVDKWKPEYKTLKKVAIGKCFFGLITVYKYYWSDWVTLESGDE